jgi:hypothetical protein
VVLNDDEKEVKDGGEEVNLGFMSPGDWASLASQLDPKDLVCTLDKECLDQPEQPERDGNEQAAMEEVVNIDHVAPPTPAQRVPRVSLETNTFLAMDEPVEISSKASNSLTLKRDVGEVSQKASPKGRQKRWQKWSDVVFEHNTTSKQRNVTMSASKKTRTSRQSIILAS